MKRTNNGLKLNFSLVSSEDRAKYIEQLIKDWDREGRNLRKQDLELLGTYLLYGQDQNGETPISKKEVEVDTHYTTYSKSKPASLDELIEQPTFNEGLIRQNPTPYRIPKPKFDRELYKDIKELEPLYKEIDKFTLILKARAGKLQQDPDNPEITEAFTIASRLTQDQIYHLKHLVIELRREQFTIKDQFRPILQPLPLQSLWRGGEKEAPIIWQNGYYEVAPLGLYTKGSPRFLENKEYRTEDYQYNTKAPYIFDFRNPDHIYFLFEFWEDLVTSAANDPESTVPQILDTLNFYRDGANLTDKQNFILDQKIQRVPNEIIAKEVNQKFNSTHTSNYISTLYKQTICGLISDYARLHYDEFCARRQGDQWKKCRTCGKLLLLDSRNFVRNNRIGDKFSNQCKVCDKEKRDLKKLEVK